MPTGITKGAIIKAQDIYDRYKDIIDSLLTKAAANITTLKNAITTFTSTIDSDAAREAFQYLSNAVTSYHEEHGQSYVHELTLLSAELSALETQWHNPNDPHNVSNSAHGGVEEYTTDYTTYSSRLENPLHVIKGLSIRNDTYPADGRVNQSDFIGAYHFQNTIESLYSIASRLRDIQIQISRSKGTNNINIGQDNPYKDLKTIKDNPNYVSSNYINVDALKDKVIPFHDWILNSNLNGNKIAVGDDPWTHPEDPNVKPTQIPQVHGWVKSTEDPNVRYPSALKTAMKNAEYFINKNTIGRQITRNLRNRTSEVSSYGKNEPVDLSSFYYNDNTADKYGRQPTKGIAKEYLTLKFGTEISGDDVSNPIAITSYSTPSTQLSTYFQKVITEQYTGTDENKEVVLSTNVIRSKERGKKHVVCAETVNNMFRKMNEMLVQISSSLYGKYQFSFNEREITNYGAGNPRGGLGYPEIMSWYSGGTAGGVLHFLNLSGIPAQVDHTETYSGSLRNDSYVANEKSESWSSIRAGYPWMTSAWRSSHVSNLNQIYSATNGSTVPMSYNGWKDNTGLNPTGTPIKVGNLTNSGHFYGTSNGGVYTIETSKRGNAYEQVFTRYCISHPKELSDEQTITARFYNGSNLSAVDINAKYLFMPYMMYLDYWYKYPKFESSDPNSINIKIGKFLNTDISVNKPANRFVTECGMPVQCINRNSIWNESTINGSYNNISVALVASGYRNGNPKYLIGRDYAINRIDYQVKGIITVNEVNHTHEGYSRLRLRVDNYAAMLRGDGSEDYLEIPYLGDSNAVGQTGRNNFNGISSSTVYFGKNNYNVPGENQPYSTFYTDAIDSIIYDRYKFNDFYDDNDLLVKNSLVYGDVEKYFSCGGDNLYLGGNKTMFWNWYIQKSPTTGVKKLQLYPYFQNTASRDGKNMIQGNFFFSANHSDMINVSSNATGSIGGNVYYKYVPIPNPVTITEFTADPTESENNITIKGYCYAWWNNLARANFIINFNNASQTVSYLNASAEYSTSSSYPDIGKRPFAASQVESHVVLNGDSMEISSNWNASNERFEFTAVGSKAFPDDYAGEDLTVSYRFTNEDGGFREYTNQKVETAVSPNLSKSYSCLIPYFLRKVSDLVKIGDIVEPSALSSRSAAQNAISSTSYDGVSISSFSVLGWIRNIDEQATITATDDTNLEVLSCNPRITAMGGWVGVKTKVMIPEQIADTLNDGQSIKLKVTFGSIRGDSGDGAGIFFGNENTTLKDINSISPGDIRDVQGFDENDKPWSNFDTDSFNAAVLYRLVSKQFDNIDGINASNIISKGGKIIIQQDLERPDIGIIPDNRVFTFNKIFKVHKTSNADCYIINNLFFELGGDSFVNPDGSGIDWGAFQIRLDKVIQ